MKCPEYVAGQAFLVIIGGPYCDSAIANDIIESTSDDDEFVDIDFVGKTLPFEDFWTFAKKDIRWVKKDSPRLANNELWTKKVQRAINSHGGAWVLRVYVK